MQLNIHISEDQCLNKGDYKCIYSITTLVLCVMILFFSFKDMSGIGYLHDHWMMQFVFLVLMNLAISILIIIRPNLLLFIIFCIVSFLSVAPIYDPRIIILIGLWLFFCTSMIWNYPNNIVVLTTELSLLCFSPKPTKLWTESMTHMFSLSDRIFVFCSLLPIVVCFIWISFLYSRNINMERSIKILNNTITNLSMANIGFQNYSSSIERQSILNERKRISSELHDTIGFTLTSINMLLQNVAEDLGPDKSPILKNLIMAQTLCKEGLQSVRLEMRALRILEEERPSASYIDTIYSLTSIFSQATGTRVLVHPGNSPHNFKSASIDNLLINFVKEGMTNSFRHGKSTQIDIFFWQYGNTFQGIVRDNGEGCPFFKLGLGLSGLKEKVEKLQGTVDFSNLKSGFQVRVMFPYSIMEDDLEDENG